jgi:SAM-dependent methyltransferase
MIGMARRIKRFLRNYRNRFMTNQAIFASIYKNGKWGNDKSRDFNSGSGSHNSSLVNPYINSLKQFFSKRESVYSVADLGCGDFAVGLQTINLFNCYYAIDVVPELIKYNQHSIVRENLTFMHLDITSNPLPNVEVVIARQVLQHLSNAQILKVIENLPQAVRFLIVTEHIPHDRFEPNADIMTGHETRLVRNSGVVLHEYPFNLMSSQNYEICRVTDQYGAIVTTCYENPRKSLD